MGIPDSFLDDLVGRTDITELVSGYVRLTKRSGNNMFGLCPFHSEKSPSFSVNADKQIYHCFGCGKGGGAINFMMEIENIPFRDAVEILARRAGLTVPESGMSDDIALKRRRMLDLNRDAARHFHEVLKSPAAESAREYLARRGITKTSVTRFGIGAAPDSWTVLLDVMTKKGYSRQELLEAGLVRSSRKEGGAYDMFRNRIMFPVIDVRGSVIGFSGRMLGDGEPKYLNSPDTLVFNKSRSLFALNLAKKTKAGMLILVEGNIDVVSLHQAGFDSAVASLGTALTAEQARLMSRYTEKTVVAFDSDEAGRKAALRAIPLIEKTGMSVKVIDLGASKDPDEYLKKHGTDAFTLLIERGETHNEFRLMAIQSKADMNSDEGRISFLAAATELLAEIESRPEREIYGIRVAQTAGVSPESVHNEVSRRFKARKVRQRKDFEKGVTRPPAMQQADRSQREKNAFSAAAEEGVVRCLVRDPALFRVTEEEGFKGEEFTSEFLKKVYEMIAVRISEQRDARESMLLSELPLNEASHLARILQKPETLSHGEKTIREYIERIRAEKFRTENPDVDTLLEIKRFKSKE